MRLKAPAKLNLMLRITGRRADGYHLLQTVMDPIDWCDDVCLRRRRDGRIVRRHGRRDIPPGADLAVRAALALQQASGTRFGVDLVIVKHLPMGAGLGGGSADAAAVLRGLNQLWRLHWSKQQLSELALSLGTDVVGLLDPQPVWAEGIGEQVQPIHLPARHYVVIFPQVAAATAGMYASPALQRDSPESVPSDFDPQRDIDNAFQPVAVQMWPEIAVALDWLRARAPLARLTGSGSAIFAEAPDRVTARAIARACPAKWLARACRSWRRRSDPHQD